ncbi:MAG TPA: PfkB family carbohydrate kinase [Acidobacteriaceae bacterium]
MSILVVGSVAFDGIETPAGTRERCLGGAATYFALAASFFTDVRVLAVVGEDFTEAEEARLTARGIDTRGIEHVPGKSFFWRGSYLKDLNVAETLATELNVFETFSPQVPEAYADSEFLFLANIDPVLQARVRAQLPGAAMVCGDTMNYWIGAHREKLLKVLPDLDALVINDGEVRLLSGETNLVQATEAVLRLGPKSLIVKHGEYGATAFFGPRAFAPEAGAASATVDGRAGAVAFRAPALPLGEVVDPTGAGDAFAGGFYGYLASQPARTLAAWKTAMFYGGVMGSFAVERFGTEGLESVTRERIEERFAQLRALSHLE